ncbi:hypothetical protein Thiowin_03383 [Thiorhodovibrio winogradskyi]|uniref:Antitoxin n=1 Tax=Thiorhodovibrio winogradskyi TaxID=77007 RepID=A0ABZ0SDC1_9GAMM|nr:prevent-host-death protein [Thiorhodovibrio winogradskyi]
MQQFLSNMFSKYMTQNNSAKAYVNMVESGEAVWVLRNGKPMADIVPIIASLPSWKQRKVQPLVIGGVSVSQMILEERAFEK